MSAEPPLLQALAAARAGTPLFDEMARDWAAQGRTVPGRPDPLWDRLVAGSSGRGRRRRPLPRPRPSAA